MIRDSLAKALYCRTVATIVRRANSLKRLGSTLGTLSSDSNESVHNQADVSNFFLFKAISISPIHPLPLLTTIHNYSSLAPDFSLVSPGYKNRIE